MTYSEDLRNETLSELQARRVIESHCLSFDDFLSECGSAFDGKTIANWLGY